MDTLPKFIHVIDDAWKSCGDGARWQRVDANDRTVLEEHVDALVCAHADAIADSLQQAGVLEENTKLLVLGTQVDNVDVVLAEVDAADDAFRRLVLVESKLFRNAQAKRSVLAQVVEYGHVAQRTWPGCTLGNLFEKADRVWLAHNASDISDTLRRGEYLLLIVGDRIDRTLTTLARRFVAQENPLNASELAVVSLALYRRGSERLVVPHVASAVTVGERTLTIQVRVEDGASREVPATVTARSDLPLRSKVQGAPDGARDFLVKVAETLNPEMVAEEWELTKQPRKQLSYFAEYADADAEGGHGTRVKCAVQYGDYGREWKPLFVVVEVTATSTSARAALRGLFDDANTKGRLPTGAAIEASGAVTLRALVPHEWQEPSDLNDSLARRVVDSFRALRDALVPSAHAAAQK